jgi:hypothetical protein
VLIVTIAIVPALTVLELIFLAVIIIGTFATACLSPPPRIISAPL